MMTDQQRFDTIAASGGKPAVTPNLNRLVRRGVAFEQGYSICPACVPARHTLMTGCEPSRTGWISNWAPASDVPGRCGPYPAESMGSAGHRRTRDSLAPDLDGDDLLALEVEQFPRERIKQFARGGADIGEGAERA